MKAFSTRTQGTVGGGEGCAGETTLVTSWEQHAQSEQSTGGQEQEPAIGLVTSGCSSSRTLG